MTSPENLGRQFGNMQKFTPKRWVSDQEFNSALGKYHEDAPMSEADSTLARDYINQDSIKRQISTNAINEVNAKTPGEKQAHLNKTLELIKPYGGSLDHARMVHQSAMDEHHEETRRSDMAMEDAAGLNGSLRREDATGIDATMIHVSTKNKLD